MRHSKSAAALARGGPRAPHRRGVVHSNSAARLPPPASAAWGAPSDNAGGGTGNGKLEEEEEEDDEAPTGVSVADINTYFRFHPMEDVVSSPAAFKLVQDFVALNSDASASPNLKLQTADDTSCLAYQLAKALTSRKPEQTLSILTAFRILLRKESNRRSLPAATFKSLVDAVKMPLSMTCATESANVILNLCFEESNVDQFLDLGGIHPIVRFLSTPSEDLQASACGALQSVCFQFRGRHLAREAGALPALCELLSSTSAKVVVKAVGALHNLSSDPLAIPIIRDSGGVPPLVKLLSQPDRSVCGSAAGAIQNLSREPGVRELIAETNAVEALTALLVSADTPSQICAAGALLNLLGPSVSETEDPADPGRVALRSLLSDGIALGAIADCLREPATSAARRKLSSGAIAEGE